MVLVMVKKTPITAAEVVKAREFLTEMEFMPLWMPDGSVARDAAPEPYAPIAGVIHDVVTKTDRATLYREAIVDVEPPTDDRPFYFVQRGGPNRQSNGRWIGCFDAMLILGALVIPFLLLPLIPLSVLSGTSAA